VSFGYCVPVMEICTLKFVISDMPDETVSVIMADVDWPDESTVPALFHVTVIGPLAVVGSQFDVAIFNVSETVPVFLM
jgi:hypothetical protein